MSFLLCPLLGRLVNSGPSNPEVVCQWCQILHLATSDRRPGSGGIRNCPCQHCCFNETERGKFPCFIGTREMKLFCWAASIILLCFLFFSYSQSFSFLKFCSYRRVKFCVYVSFFFSMCSSTSYYVQRIVAKLMDGRVSRRAWALELGRSWANPFTSQRLSFLSFQVWGQPYLWGINTLWMQNS